MQSAKSKAWHPYTNTSKHCSELNVVKAKDCKIYTKEHGWLVDGISSWWSICHGHGNRFITNSVVKQVKNLPHVMFAGLTHKPAEQLSEDLCNFLNSARHQALQKNDKDNGFEKVFLCDSGSVAIEVALKIARGYYQNLGLFNKKQVICFNNSYHGDTAGGMSVSYGLSDVSFANQQNMDVLRLALPQSDADFELFEELIKKTEYKTCAVIHEPILQGACGMILYEPQKLDRLCKITQKYDILNIFDECATGFYRLGKPFAFSFLEFTPDIITLSKALTGGFVGLGACVVKQKIFDAFNKSQSSPLMHGPTFMANPIACSAAIASVAIFKKTDYANKISQIQDFLNLHLQPLKNLKGIKDVRVLGAMAVAEATNLNNNININDVRAFFVKQGVWLRPFRSQDGTIAIYTMPPFVIKKAELIKITNSIKLFAEEFCSF
jgi:adenosylmethionine---8-amino-7-oxononanoate aminotransferase